jgi:hypothetical protein
MKNMFLISVAFFLFSNFTSTAQKVDKIFVGEVTNSIKIGSFIGNKNLAFGVKNIAQEVLMDNENYILIENEEKADLTIEIEIFFFDLVNTKTGISIFHKEVSTTVIRMRGTIYKNGKKVKQEISEGKSSEISTSTILIDEGGNFNQESASSAIKKTTIQLIEKLL